MRRKDSDRNAATLHDLKSGIDDGVSDGLSLGRARHSIGLFRVAGKFLTIAELYVLQHQSCLSSLSFAPSALDAHCRKMLR